MHIFNATHISAFVYSFSLHDQPCSPFRVLCTKLTCPPTSSALAYKKVKVKLSLKKKKKDKAIPVTGRESP
jgi:hypothetical protein